MVGSGSQGSNIGSESAMGRQDALRRSSVASQSCMRPMSPWRNSTGSPSPRSSQRKLQSPWSLTGLSFARSGART